MSLSAHLTADTAEHGRLRFHPDCPRCRHERLAGNLRSDSLSSRRAQAALAAGLLAFSTAAPAAVAQVPATDPQQETAPPPGGEPPGLESEFDPGGGNPDSQDTFDNETAPVPGGPQAGGEEDEGLGPPVETEPPIGPDEGQPLEDAPAPAPAAPPEPAPAPTPTPPPAPLPPAPAPPAAAPQQPAPPAPAPPQPQGAPVAETEQPASRERSTKSEPRPRVPKTHEVERWPAIGTSPAPPPESPAPQNPAPVVEPAATPAPPPTVPVSQPSEAPAGPIRGTTYTVRAGDSLWSIAKRVLDPRASAAEIAREVNRLWELNKDRIATGDPDLLRVGTRLEL